ncbi:MAG: hypothetical protein SPK04_07860, partial [Succinivibrionaceae bacterium]|nr:hypothetical protein [Succinivibrionaceae bacterium]
MAYFINDSNFINLGLYKTLKKSIKENQEFYDEGFNKLTEEVDNPNGYTECGITIRTLLDFFIPNYCRNRTQVFDLFDILSLREILKHYNLMFLPLGNPENMSIDSAIDLISYFDIEKEAEIKELIEYALKLENNKPDPQMLEKARIAQNFCKLLHVFNELYYFTNDDSRLTNEQILFLEKLIFSSNITQSMKDFLYKALDSIRYFPLEKNYIRDDDSFLREITDIDFRNDIDLILIELACYGNINRKFETHYRQEKIKNKFYDIYHETIYDYLSKRKSFHDFEYSINHILHEQSDDISKILISMSCICFPNLVDTTNLQNAKEELDKFSNIVDEYRYEHTTKETFDHFKEECRTLLTKYKLYNPDEIIFHDDNEELIVINQKLKSPFLYGSNLLTFFTYHYLFPFAPMDGKKILTDDDQKELYSNFNQALENLYNEGYTYSYPHNITADKTYLENIAYRLFVECYLNKDLEIEAPKAFKKLVDRFIKISNNVPNNEDLNYELMCKLIAVYAFLHHDVINDETLKLIINSPKTIFFSEFIIRAMIDKEINFDERKLLDCFYHIIISKYITHHYHIGFSANKFSTFLNLIIFNNFKDNEAIKEILLEKLDEISFVFESLEVYHPNFEKHKKPYSYYGRSNFFLSTYLYTSRQDNQLTQDLERFGKESLLQTYIEKFIAPSLRLINSDEFAIKEEFTTLNKKFTLIGKHFERYSHAISEFHDIVMYSLKRKEIKKIIHPIQKPDSNTQRIQEIKEFHLKNSPISYKDLKEFWKLDVQSKFNNFKINSDLATLFNLYAIPNNQVEDPSYMPVSSFGGFIFLEKPLFIPDFLFEKIKAYRYALEASLELKTINYLKEIFLYKVTKLIKKKKPSKKMAQEIEIFAKLNGLDFKAQCKEYRNEIKNLTNLDVNPAQKELKDDYALFIYFNLLKYIDSINLIKTKFKTKLQLSAKEAVVYLGKDEILDLKDYVQIILKYDPLKKNEAQNGRIMELSSKINQDNKKVKYFDKEGHENTKKLRNYSDIISLFEPNQDEIIIPSLVAKKNLNFKDIDEKIKETKEVHDILIPIFTDKNEITPIVPV